MPRRPRRLSLENLFAAAACSAVAAPVPAVCAARRDGARQCEPPEEEVAIVAQEGVNANHPQQQGRTRVAPPHARTPTLRAALGDQLNPLAPVAAHDAARGRAVAVPALAA